MNFTELLDEYMEKQKTGPDERNGYSDKAYYNRMHWLREAMNSLAPGEVSDVD